MLKIEPNKKFEANMITKFLDAVAFVETDRNDKAVGKLGEVSRYQLTPHNWITFGGNAKRWTDPHYSFTVASMYLQDILRNIPIEMHGSPYWLAACWNYGWPRTKKAFMEGVPLPHCVDEYASRVQNAVRTSQA